MRTLANEGSCLLMATPMFIFFFLCLLLAFDNTVVVPLLNYHWYYALFSRLFTESIFISQ